LLVRIGDDCCVARLRSPAGLRRESTQLRKLGLDEWARQRGLNLDWPVLAWIVAVVGASMIVASTQWPHGIAKDAILWLLGLVVWLVPMSVIGRAMSLEHADSVREQIPVAEFLGVCIPSDPSWWQEGKELWKGRGRAALRLLVGLNVVALTATVLLDNDTTANALAGLSYFASLVGLALLYEKAINHRRDQFKRRVGMELAQATGDDLKRVRARREKELNEIEQRLVERQEADRLYARGGVQHVLVDHHEKTRSMLREILSERGEADKRSERHFSVRLTVISALISLIIGFLLAIWAHSLGWT